MSNLAMFKWDVLLVKYFFVSSSLLKSFYSPIKFCISLFNRIKKETQGENRLVFSYINYKSFFLAILLLLINTINRIKNSNVYILNVCFVNRIIVKSVSPEFTLLVWLILSSDIIPCIYIRKLIVVNVCFDEWGIRFFWFNEEKWNIWVLVNFCVRCCSSLR